MPDGPSFAGIFHNYFRREQFRFPVEGESPLIIDGGANAGLSVFYWKHLCPGARVCAFEPDPKAFAALTANCGDLAGVSLKQLALWTHSDGMSFTAEGSDGGYLSQLVPKKDSRKEIRVQSVRLRDLLVEPVELLKLDIEGAEIEVLLDCAERLSLVKWMFVEYHGFINKPLNLGEFLRAIENAGFRIYCGSDQPAAQPFISRPVHNGKELHLDVFAFRASP